MRHRIKHLTLICSLFIFNNLCLLAQDKSVDIHLNNSKLLFIEVKEIFKSGVYSKQNGFWVISSMSNSKEITRHNLRKYAPDLSKMEWEVKPPAEGTVSNFIYDGQNPTFFYLVHDEGGMVSNKSTIVQISPDGKATKKERNKDETLDEHIFSYCDATHYCEVWTKEKSEDLTIVKYEHQSMRRTKLNVNVPKGKDAKDFEDWTFGGKTDSTMVMLRYGKKDNEGAIQVSNINLSDGKLIKQFLYRPDLGKIKLAPAFNDRYTEGVTHNDTRRGDPSHIGLDYKLRLGAANDMRYNNNAYGNVKPAPDGNGFYFYAMTNYSGKNANLSGNPQSEGYVLNRLDSDGKEVWSKKVQFTKEEVGNTFFKNPAQVAAMIIDLKNLKEDNALSMEITYYNTQLYIPIGEDGIITLGTKYDFDGKIVDKCRKTIGIKLRIANTAKETVSSTEELLPCYSKVKAQKVITFIDKKGGKGAYSAYASKGAYILTFIPEKDDKTVQCFYFKE